MTSLSEFRELSLPLGEFDGRFCELDDSWIGLFRAEENLDASESFADRATDRMLLVSESRGAEVGPGVLAAVVPLEGDVDGDTDCGFRNESPERLSFAKESDEVDSADMGDSSSGVEDRVLVSTLRSSNCF